MRTMRFLHVEIQSFCFSQRPSRHRYNGSLGCQKFRPEAEHPCSTAVAKGTCGLQHAMKNAVGRVSSNNFTGLGRTNERLFKRIIPAGNSRHPEESDGRGRRLIARPSQFRTRAIHS